VYTDRVAWQAYERLPESWRAHASVCHTPGQREWTRDNDGDGVREVHCNTMERVWTGLRNFIRPFRGVNKDYPDQYVAVFQIGYIAKAITPALLSYDARLHL
jgi:transposase